MHATKPPAANNVLHISKSSSVCGKSGVLALVAQEVTARLNVDGIGCGVLCKTKVKG
jgi:hypothetical protein